jgi:hypothetical protein
LAADAGLLSSCARPADIRPSAASFSRCSVAPSIRASTGRNTRMTRVNATGVSNSSRRNGSGAMRATRLRSAARSVTCASTSEIARIAPIQVGARWRFSRSSRPSMTKYASKLPSRTSENATPTSPALTSVSPGSSRRSSAAAAQSPSRSSSTPSKRSIARSSSTVTVMRRPGTGG